MRIRERAKLNVRTRQRAASTHRTSESPADALPLLLGWRRDDSWPLMIAAVASQHRICVLNCRALLPTTPEAAATLARCACSIVTEQRQLNSEEQR